MGAYQGTGSRIFSGNSGSAQAYRQPVRLYDNVSLLKPLGAVVIDAISPVNNGDRVLFGALAGAELADHDKVFRAVVSAGLVTSWALDVDNNSPSGTARDGDIIYVQEGTTYGDKLYKYTGTTWSEIGGGAAGANQFLSNLLATTAVSQSLIPQAVGKDLGTAILPWANAFITKVQAGAGTSALPSYSFSGDTNTGFYSDTADTICVTTGGVQRWQFTTTAFTPVLDNTYNIGRTSFVVNQIYVRDVQFWQGGGSNGEIVGSATGLSIRGTNPARNVTISGGSASAATAAGNIIIAGGVLQLAATVPSGSVSIASGAGTLAGTTTATGNVTISTANNLGTVAGANSGTISITAGTVVGGTRGRLDIDVRLVTSTSSIHPTVTNTHDLGSGSANWRVVYSRLFLGNAGSLIAFGSDFNTGLPSSFESGYSNTTANVNTTTVRTGNMLSGGSGTIGDVLIRGGDNFEVTNNNNSGGVQIFSGTSNNTSGTPRTGHIQIFSGTPTGTNVGTGSILMTIAAPTGTGVQGDFKFLKTGAAPVVGHVWTCSNVDGTGYYAAAGGGGGPTWTKYTVNFNDVGIFVASSLADQELFSLPAKGVIHQVVIKHSTAFNISGYTLSVGDTTNYERYASAFNVNDAVTNILMQSSISGAVPNIAAATSIRVRASTSIGAGANLNTAIAGVAEIWVLTSTLT